MAFVWPTAGAPSLLPTRFPLDVPKNDFSFDFSAPTPGPAASTDGWVGWDKLSAAVVAPDADVALSPKRSRAIAHPRTIGRTYCTSNDRDCVVIEEDGRIIGFHEADAPNAVRIMGMKKQHSYSAHGMDIGMNGVQKMGASLRAIAYSLERVWTIGITPTESARRMAQFITNTHSFIRAYSIVRVPVFAPFGSGRKAFFMRADVADVEYKKGGGGGDEDMDAVVLRVGRQRCIEMVSMSTIACKEARVTCLECRNTINSDDRFGTKPKTDAMYPTGYAVVAPALCVSPKCHEVYRDRLMQAENMIRACSCCHCGALERSFLTSKEPPKLPMNYRIVCMKCFDALHETKRVEPVDGKGDQCSPEAPEDTVEVEIEEADGAKPCDLPVVSAGVLPVTAFAAKA